MNRPDEPLAGPRGPRLRLRDLDDRLVPAMAEWVDRLVSRLPSPPDICVGTDTPTQ